MEWDCFNNVSIDKYCATGIPSSADYSKIIAYGGQITTWGLIPSQDAVLVAPYLVILDNYGYNNDGAVPIQSALFQNASGVRTRQVDGSCDHFQIYSGQSKVYGGTPIFDSVTTDLQTVVQVSLPSAPVITSVSPPAFTGLPIGQTRLVRIIGSGFTGGSTLTFNDEVTSYPGRVPSFVSENELDYNITPGTAQANRIRDLVNAHPHASLLLNKLDLLIDTVHKFQGDERDVIIFSPVVSKGIADGAVGFLKKTDNLFNVAITRARPALIVVGDPIAAKNAGVSYLAAFSNYVEDLGKNPRQGPVRSSASSLGADYPVVAKPELALQRHFQ